MIDKRERLERQEESKRRKLENGEEVAPPVYATQFSQEEIAAEERRPKKKAAVLIGYSGTGYHGMQLYVAIFDCWKAFADCSLETRTKRPSRVICLRPLLQPGPSPRPMGRTRKSPRLFDVRGRTRVCMQQAMLCH